MFFFLINKNNFGKKGEKAENKNSSPHNQKRLTDCMQSFMCHTQAEKELTDVLRRHFDNRRLDQVLGKDKRSLLQCIQ